MERDELQAAEAHIARLEEELLRLKDVKRELQNLRAEHAKLRRSAVGRIARIFAAPLRIFRSNKPPSTSDYEKWFEKHRAKPAELAKLRERQLPHRPLVSILTPTFMSDPDFLRAAVESVKGQVYENWELILVDDGSNSESLQQQLAQFAKDDSRIRYLVREERGGISAALNTGVAAVRGEWIGLLDHDDWLEPDAIFRVIEALQKHQDADVFYSDEDKIVDGHLASPMFKPDWSPELFLTHDYLGHLLVIRRDLVSEGFRSEFDGAQDYELLLRIWQITGRIYHIPRVLYHWRRTKESTAHNIRRKPGALEAGRAAVQQFFEQRNVSARVTIDWTTHTYRPRFEDNPIPVSIFLLGNAHENRVRENTDYRPLAEIRSLDGSPAKVRGELLLFLDPTLVPLQKDWLSLMVEQMQIREIGAVGARILRSDEAIESAGYVLMQDESAHPAFAGFSRHHAGFNRQLRTVRNYSALTASCLLTRRELFETIDDPASFLQLLIDDPVCAGVEYCLQLQEKDFRAVAIPYAELKRTTESRSEVVRCPAAAKRWPDFFACDPHYNPNLSRGCADFSLGN